MKFLYDKELHEAVAEIMREPGARCAVAFWGSGAEKLIHASGGAKVICNLKAGGTNPYVIKALQGAKNEVRQLDDLHAKVYLGAERAIVTSANASANGLALEGREQTHWREAGFLVDGATVQPIAAWFEERWAQSAEVAHQHLEAARVAWERRQRNKPTRSFLDYDIDAATRNGTLPLIMWWSGNDSPWVSNEQNVEASLGSYTPDIKDRVENRSEKIESETDRPLLTKGTWILFWERSGRKQMRSNSKLAFVYLDQLVPGAVRHKEGEAPEIDAILWSDDPPPEPIGLKDRLLIRAFEEVISRDEFRPMRQGEGPAWYAPIRDQTQLFWRHLQDHYRELLKNSPAGA